MVSNLYILSENRLKLELVMHGIVRTIYTVYAYSMRSTFFNSISIQRLFRVDTYNVVYVCTVSFMQYP